MIVYFNCILPRHQLLGLKYSQKNDWSTTFHLMVSFIEFNRICFDTYKFECPYPEAFSLYSDWMLIAILESWLLVRSFSSSYTVRFGMINYLVMQPCLDFSKVKQLWPHHHRYNPLECYDSSPRTIDQYSTV